MSIHTNAGIFRPTILDAYVSMCVCVRINVCVRVKECRNTQTCRMKCICIYRCQNYASMLSELNDHLFVCFYLFVSPVPHNNRRTHTLSRHADISQSS